MRTSLGRANGENEADQSSRRYCLQALESDPNSTCKNDSPVEFFSLKMFVLFLGAVVGAVLFCMPDESRKVEENSVYIMGGGFSGFWYTLGRLERFQQSPARNDHFYCFSAGCLAAVAVTVANVSMPVVLDIAETAQSQWQKGMLSQYNVVPFFVDHLLEQLQSGNADNCQVDSSHGTCPLRQQLERLNIITTARNYGWGGMAVAVQNPQSVEHLRTLLLQTTWIPFVVGSALWHKSKPIACSDPGCEPWTEAMDGGFALIHHPKCARTIGLEWDWDLLTNILNVNLSREKAFQFYEMGLQYGKRQH